MRAWTAAVRYLHRSSFFRQVAEVLAVFLAQSAATLVYLRPAWRVWCDSLAPDLGDPLFNVYILDWTLARWHQGLKGLWNANFYHPIESSLALSDHLLSPALIALPVADLTGSTIAAYNLLFFLSFPLAAALAYLVLRNGGISRLPAFVGATAYAFSHFRWGQASHLQILFAPLIPVVLWTFDRLLAQPTLRRAITFISTYALHATGGIYLAYMIHLPLAALAANRAFGSPGWRSWLSARRLAILSACAGAATLLSVSIFLPYVEVSERFELTRRAEEYRQFGGTSVSLLTPSHHSPLFELATPVLSPLAPRFPGDSWFAEKNLFPGFLPSLLAVAGAALIWTRCRRRRLREIAAWRRGLLLLATSVPIAAFVAADLYTLGWWPAGGPPWLQLPDIVYTGLGLAFGVGLTASLSLYYWWCGSGLDCVALSAWHRGLLLAGACCLLASFPVVFEPLSHVVPGLAGMRVPARFVAIASFAIACLAAVGAEGLLAKIPSRSRLIVAGAVVVTLFVELAPAPLDWHHLPTRSEFPAVYSWLANEGDGAILELPFGDGVGELSYMYFSTLHRRPLVNGYSGYQPPTYLRLRKICCWPVPDDDALRELRRLGVSELVVHPVWDRSWAHRAYEEWLEKVHSGEVSGVKEVYSDASGDRVFTVDGP